MLEQLIIWVIKKGAKYAWKKFKESKDAEIGENFLIGAWTVLDLAYAAETRTIRDPSHNYGKQRLTFKSAAELLCDLRKPRTLYKTFLEKEDREKSFQHFMSVVAKWDYKLRAPSDFKLKELPGSKKLPNTRLATHDDDLGVVHSYNLSAEIRMALDVLTGPVGKSLYQAAEISRKNQGWPSLTDPPK